MYQYQELVQRVLTQGFLKDNRTGVRARTIAGAMLQHDMSKGFPLLTTKKMAHKAMRVELEFFIRGLSSKTWLQDRGCHIWDEWCNPELVPSGFGDECTKQWMLEEDDLGPVYGTQWRNFDNSGIDQFKDMVFKLRNSPNDRRMVVSAWNPKVLNQQALPPCHVLFHVTVINGTLNLCWFQRSCDVMLGIPFNLASYGLLLHLLALEAGLKEGTLTGFLSDVHIYENHATGALEQRSRKPRPLPKVETNWPGSIFGWEYKDTKFVGYEPHDKISFQVAV